MDNSPVPAHMAMNEEDIEDSTYPVPALPAVVNGDDKVFVFHTSGSTSGSPKLVPCSYRWLDTIIRKAGQVSKPRNPSRQDVTVWMFVLPRLRVLRDAYSFAGEVCVTSGKHSVSTASSFWIQYADLPQVLLGSLQHASCVIQPTKLPFSTDELLDMVYHCGLNRLNQFATHLSSHFRNCRLNPKAVAMLASFDEVLYSGLALPVEDQDWAYRNGIRLRVRSAPVSRVIASF